MSSTKKATLYIDIDDEITTIIDKVTTSKDKIVALVLPKRATVLQSVVNMKLLKRSADTSSKKIVLITSDSGVVPLAGIAGVHVAKTLQSKPEIPEAPNTDDPSEELDDDVTLDKTKSIAALSGDDEEEVAEVPEAEPVSGKKKVKKSGEKKNKKLKIPDFTKFRTKLILAVLLLILLIGGWIFALKILPKAEIVIKTDTKTFSKDLKLAAAIAKNEETLQAKVEQLEKSESQTVPATGEKNVGKKAEGKLELTNCIDDGKDHTIPAGTAFTRNGKTFTTTQNVKLQEALFNSGDECQGVSGLNKKSVDAIASDGGASFNIGEGAYNSSIAGINAYGSDMKGGTDDIKRVVSQGDINTATQQLKDKTSTGTVEELKAQLISQGYIPFESSFKAEEPVISASESANTEASAVTVSGTAKFQMVGVVKQEIDDAIKEAAREDIDDSAQSISSSGIDTATLRLSEVSPGVYDLTIQTLVTAGAQLNADNLKQEILGKKYSESESILSAKAGVVDVDIDYSPFWVGATPNNVNKITITIENIAEDE